MSELPVPFDLDLSPLTLTESPVPFDLPLSLDFDDMAPQML